MLAYNLLKVGGIVQKIWNAANLKLRITIKAKSLLIQLNLQTHSLIHIIQPQKLNILK